MFANPLEDVNNAIDKARTKLGRQHYPNPELGLSGKDIIIALPEPKNMTSPLLNNEERLLIYIDRIGEFLEDPKNAFVKTNTGEIIQIEEYWNRQRKIVEDPIQTRAIIGLINPSIHNQLTLSRSELEEYLLDPKPKEVEVRNHCVGIKFGSTTSDKIKIFILYSFPNSDLPSGIKGFKAEHDAIAALEKAREHYDTEKQKITEDRNLFSYTGSFNIKGLEHLPGILSENLRNLVRFGTGVVNITSLDDFGSGSTDSAKDLLKRLRALSSISNFEEAATLLISRHMAEALMVDSIKGGFAQNLVKELKKVDLNNAPLTKEEQTALEEIDKLCSDLIAKIYPEKVKRFYFAPVDPLDKFIDLVLDRKKYDSLIELLQGVNKIFKLDDEKGYELLRFAITTPVIQKAASNEILDLAKYEHSHKLHSYNCDDTKRASNKLGTFRESSDVRAIREFFKFIREELKVQKDLETREALQKT